MYQKLPEDAKKYFWGDNLKELVWPKHKKYITQTLLEHGDVISLQWLFTRISRLEIQKLLPSLKLRPKSNNFWRIYLS